MRTGGEGSGTASLKNADLFLSFFIFIASWYNGYYTGLSLRKSGFDSPWRDQYGALVQRLECRPVTPEVMGSNPIGIATRKGKALVREIVPSGLRSNLQARWVDTYIVDETGHTRALGIQSLNPWSHVGGRNAYRPRARPA